MHYCVTNMPGAVARTSTFALNNATLPFILALADKGVGGGAWPTTRTCSTASTCYRGRIAHPAVADALRLEAADSRALLAR